MDTPQPAPADDAANFVDEDDAAALPALDPFRDADLAAVFVALTDKQRTYVEARLQGMTKLASARAAGYAQPEVNAYRIEKHPAVYAALRKAAESTSARVDLKRDDIVRGMQDAINSAATATELIAAWREIGKLVGAYEPAKIELTMRLDEMAVAQLQRMPTEQLIELSKGEGYMVEADKDPNNEAYELMQDAVRPPEPVAREHPGE